MKEAATRPSCLDCCNLPSGTSTSIPLPGDKRKTPESDSSRVVLEAKTKTLSSQVQGFRSMTEGGADAPSICLIKSCLAYANTPVWGQLDSYWLVNSGDDMCHQISFDPTDNTCFNVCHLEKLWKLWVCRAANNVNHICLLYTSPSPRD